MKSPALRSSLPALATIVLCFLVQAVEQGFQVGTPTTLNFNAGRFNTAVVLNLGLLFCLPVIGAVGAAISKHLGYSRTATFKSVISPVALVSAMLTTLLIADFITTRALLSSLSYSSGILLGWVVVPAMALLAGGYAGCRITPERPWYLRYL